MGRKSRGQESWQPAITVGEIPDPLGEWGKIYSAALASDDIPVLVGMLSMLIEALEPAPGHNCARNHVHQDPHPDEDIYPGEYHHHHDEACTPTYKLSLPNPVLKRLMEVRT